MSNWKFILHVNAGIVNKTKHYFTHVILSPVAKYDNACGNAPDAIPGRMYVVKK